MPKASPSLPSLPSLPRLLTALEARLEALTTGLEQVDVTGKGLDLIKEIKELHTILSNLREDSTDKSPPTLTVVWGDAHAASSQTTPPHGTGKGAASPTVTAARAAKTARSGKNTDNATPPATPKVTKHA